MMLNQYLRPEDIETMRNDIARQLTEGLAIVDSRVKEIIVIETLDGHKVEIEGVRE